MNPYRLLFFLFLIGQLPLHAQELKLADFDHYTKADGLSDNSVAGIAQDSTGYLWIGTVWGLNRFDGRRFVQYHSTNDSASLPIEECWRLTWLDKYRLGVMNSGLHIVDTRTSQTRNIFIPYHNKKYQFKFNMVMRVKGDAEGNIYMVTRSGFYHYDKAYKLVSRFDYYKEAEVPLYHFYFGNDLFELDDKRLMITSINGLYIYDKEEKVVRKMAPADCPIMAEFLSYAHTGINYLQTKPGVFFVFKLASDTLVYVDINRGLKTVSAGPLKPIMNYIGWRSKLLQVSDTLLYLSGQLSGIYKLHINPQTGAIRFYPGKELDSYLCTDLIKTTDNRIVIATNKGFLRQRAGAPFVQTAVLPPSLEEKFANLKIADVYASANKVYAGTYGGGLLVFDKKTLQYQENIQFGHLGFGANYVRAMAAVNQDTLLIGMDGVICLLRLSNGVVTKLVPPGWNDPADWTGDLFRDSKKNIWISSNHVYRYNTTTGAFTHIPLLPQLLEVPSVIQEDRQQNIWLTRHGIARYNTRSGAYDLYIDSFPYTKMPDKQVNALDVDGQNTVWFNSVNNGLLAYNPDKKTFRHFTRENGLPDDNVSSLMVVGSKVWIACYSGVACIDTQSFQIRSFGREDGFPEGTIVKGARFFYDSIQRQLYIGFTNAVARFSPDQILQKNRPPQTFIESIVVNGKKTYYLPSQTLAASWKDKELTVTIGSINFEDGSTQRYAYRLAETENAPWIDLGEQAVFSIPGLSPGRHRLQVKLYSATSRWQEQVREIKLDISPPLWLEPWFLVVMGVLMLGLLYLFIRWRTSLARREEMVNTQIQKLKAENYKAQFELEQIANYFSTSLANKKTEDEVLWDVAGNLIGRMNYEDCIIYCWNKTKTKMVQKAAYGPKGKPEVISAYVFEVEPGQGIVGHVIQTRKPLLVSDTRNDSRYRVDDDFRLSEVAVPIIHNNELIGVIDSENSQANYYSERDIKILTTIATLLGNKLKQLESEQGLEAKKRELASINEQLAEARLSALQTQMNPHFVFNALNSIKRMILDGDNERASRYLSKFALMIRMTLEHSKETFVTLHENIEYLKAYLDMEKLRFHDTFIYSIHSDEQVDLIETVIPSMMIQPLVENAIWHGLMYAEADKRLQVSFNQEQNKITCTVEDNGIGIRQSEKLRQSHRPMHRSVGLENLRNRIKIINEKYHTDCSLHITDLKESGINGSGTRAVLQLNLINV
ncbi:MAG: histidine kinase [Williamsia sp.]|nr:histidine kinase [Williamsia sp.]